MSESNNQVSVRQMRSRSSSLNRSSRSSTLLVIEATFRVAALSRVGRGGGDGVDFSDRGEVSWSGVRLEETKCVLALLELGMLGNSHCVLG